MPFNLQKTADQKTLNLKRDIEILLHCTRERRKALTAYWYKKSEEMKSKPHDFFDTFGPFLNNKTKDANPIFLKNKHEDGIIEDQRHVAETLANYFSTIASDIGGNHVISLTENEFNNHSSVQMIETIYSNSSFQFKHINTKEDSGFQTNLVRRKSCSDTGLMPKLMKKVAEGIAPSVTNLYNRCIENSGQLYGKGENSLLFSRKGTSIMWKMIDLSRRYRLLTRFLNHCLANK